MRAAILSFLLTACMILSPAAASASNGLENGAGDAGTSMPVYDLDPAPLTVQRPSNDRGAFIAQVGEASVATIARTSPTQYARIDQSGDNNRADVTQSGGGAHYAHTSQGGEGNTLDLLQSGIGGQVALVQQSGSLNTMTLEQQGGIVSSGLAAIQLGHDNSMSLLQAGDNNQARLVQNGSGNAMSASQVGGNNQLTWIQNGDHLSDLSIAQTGNQVMAVTQSR